MLICLTHPCIGFIVHYLQNSRYIYIFIEQDCYKYYLFFGIVSIVQKLWSYSMTVINQMLNLKPWILTWVKPNTQRLLSFSEVRMLSRTNPNTFPNFSDMRTKASWISVKEREERKIFLSNCIFFHEINQTKFSENNYCCSGKVDVVDVVFVLFVGSWYLLAAKPTCTRSLQCQATFHSATSAKKWNLLPIFTT